jgi:type VI secretion system protein ImpG
VLLFSRGESSLQQTVDAQSLALNCVPAINLFEQRCDRIQVTPRTHDFHVMVDRARPMDFEIISLLEVTGYGQGLTSERASSRCTPRSTPKTTDTTPTTRRSASHG